MLTPKKVDIHEDLEEFTVFSNKQYVRDMFAVVKEQAARQLQEWPGCPSAHMTMVFWGNDAVGMPHIKDRRSLNEKLRGRGEVVLRVPMQSMLDYQKLGTPGARLNKEDLTRVQLRLRVGIQGNAVFSQPSNKIMPVALSLLSYTLLQRHITKLSIPTAVLVGVCNVSVVCATCGLYDTYKIARNVSALSMPEERPLLAANYGVNNSFSRLPGYSWLLTQAWGAGICHQEQQ